MSTTKIDVITFKADPELARLLGTLPNKSEFIRQAVLDALASVCPLCQGSGHLTIHQKRQWDAFTEQHGLERCDQCESIHVVGASECGTDRK